MTSKEAKYYVGGGDCESHELGQRSFVVTSAVLVTGPEPGSLDQQVLECVGGLTPLWKP